MKSLTALIPLLVFTSCASSPPQTQYQSQMTEATNGAVTAVHLIGGSVTSIARNKGLVKWEPANPVMPSEDPVKAADSSIFAFRPTVYGDGAGSNSTSVTGYLAECVRK